MKTSRKITEKTILKRAEALYRILTILYERDNKKMNKDDFMKHMVKLSSGRQVYSTLVRFNIISGTKRGSRERFVHYCGLAPNIVACKKVVEDVIEQGRQWNRTFQEKKQGNSSDTHSETKNATATVQHTHTHTIVDKEPAKVGALHYNAFLKEITILKERYAMTVPNAHIEINIRVSSNTTV